MIFTPKRKCSQDLNLQINGEMITRVYETKFLGVILDHKLNWKAHILHVKNKISKTLGIPYKARQILGRSYLISLYNTLVVPYLSYCNIVWGGVNLTSLDPLIKIQKRAIRCICNLKRRASTSEYFQMTRLLKLVDINQYSQIIFIYKFSKGMLPDIFNHFFKYNNEIHSYRTRQSNLFHAPKFNSFLSKSFITYSGVLAWNAICKNVSTDLCLNGFKKCVKKLFLHNYA